MSTQISTVICRACPQRSQKIEEREALVQKRIENETKKKDPSRLMAKGSLQERRQQQKRWDRIGV